MFVCVVCVNVVDILIIDQVVFLFQAEDGIRYLVRSRGLGDVYKRQDQVCSSHAGNKAEQGDADDELATCPQEEHEVEGLSLIHI